MENDTKKPEAYLLTFVVDGKIGFSEEFTPGTATGSISAPEKYGYTFSGWMGLPAVMPEENLTVYGSFEPNLHHITYLVDGETVAVSDVRYGSRIALPEMGEKDGYTFSGFEEVPEQMPDDDLTVEGHWIPNRYRIDYVVDGQTTFPGELPCGAEVVPITEPVREFYTFSGWQNLPTVMPAHDVTVSGTFTPDSFRLICVLNGEVVREELVPYRTKIEKPEDPVEEGHTFLGWRGVPAEMPAHDVVISGVNAVCQYRLSFLVDDACIYSRIVAYGEPIPAVQSPEKEGYTFSGWSPVPDTMPASDLEISGHFTVNRHTVTYEVDGTTAFSYSVNYGDSIDVLPDPEREGFVFGGWSDIPERMPDCDLRILGTFCEIPPEEPIPEEDTEPEEIEVPEEETAEPEALSSTEELVQEIPEEEPCDTAETQNAEESDAELPESGEPEEEPKSVLEEPVTETAETETEEMSVAEEEPSEETQAEEPVEAPVEEAPVEETPAEETPVEEPYIRNYLYLRGVSVEDCKDEHALLYRSVRNKAPSAVTVYLSDEEILAVVPADPKGRGNLDEVRFSISPEGSVKGGRIVDKERFRSCIDAFWKANALPKTGISLVIDAENVRERVITVRRMSEKKILRFIETQFPPSERLSAPLFSYEVLSESRNRKNLRVFAVMADRNDVNQYTKIFGEAHIRIDSVDTVLISVLRYMSGLCRGKTGIAQCVSDYSLLSVLFVNGVYSYSVRSALPINRSANIMRKEAYASASQVLRYAFEQGCREDICDILIGGLNPSDSEICKNGIAAAYRDFYADETVRNVYGDKEVPALRFCHFVYPVSGRS